VPVFSSSFELRAAGQADAPAISAMQKASLVDTYGPLLGRGPVEEFVAAGNVERYFEERWSEATIATSWGEIVGVAVIVGRVLDLIWVTPEFRSRGVGSALMDAVERTAVTEISVLTVEVWRANRRAVAFYERRGYLLSNTIVDRQTGLDKLVMQKALEV
jgi:ribosomal protein S18 acetylase RimI-like enzyme